jgi:amino acid permease
MTIAGLLNGMVGGTILVLPIIGMSTGYLTTVLVSSLLGFLSYYTGNIVVVHLGKAKNMTSTILNHFDQNYSYMTIYAFIIFCGQIPTLMVYFNLICLQLEGLIGYQPSIGIIVVLVLLVTAFIVVYFDIG